MRERHRDVETLGNGGMVSIRRQVVEVRVTGSKIWKVKTGFCSENVTCRTRRKMGLVSWFEKSIAVFHFCL